MICNPASIDFYFPNCVSCPGVDKIRKISEDSFNEKLIEVVTFRQWISVDCCNLETIQKSTEEFIAYSVKNCWFFYVMILSANNKTLILIH